MDYSCYSTDYDCTACYSTACDCTACDLTIGTALHLCMLMFTKELEHVEHWVVVLVELIL